MLSVFDLLEAGAVDLDLAAFLMARISHGASFMVEHLTGQDKLDFLPSNPVHPVIMSDERSEERTLVWFWLVQVRSS